ncbi:MAG: hypothetical protein KGD59_12750 [Candidatus Heimdallarchaeota archaeon]|nr:hypothetical protein [Candidatus Heimdallarchaeota archaeon]MBY8995414.1 hypothetical protein [Candidatus Heimdallarchaeota archaeon]
MPFKKKSSLILISAFLLIIGFTINSMDISSHSPASLTLEYDFSQQELTANLVHSVANMNTHYIFEIEIRINDIFDSLHNYTSQPTLSVFSYTYNITAVVGDIIEVTAECIQGGSQTKQITVTNNTVTPAVPAAQVCIILIGLSSTALIKIRRRVKRGEG